MIDHRDFRSIFELLEFFPDEQSCIDLLEQRRWNGTVVSPFDPLSKVYKCKDGRYKCKNTGKYFNVRTGTLFDNTNVSLRKWFLAIYLVTGHKKRYIFHPIGERLEGDAEDRLVHVTED